MKKSDIKLGAKVKIIQGTNFAYQAEGSAYGIIVIKEKSGDFCFEDSDIFWVRVRWFDENNERFEENDYPHDHLELLKPVKEKKTKYLF